MFDFSKYNLNKTFFLEKVDEVHFKVYCEPHLHVALKKKFSYMWANYKFHPAYKAGRWDGRVSLYNYNEELFPIGLYQFFKDYCNDKKLAHVLSVDESTLSGDKVTESQLEKVVPTIFDEKFVPRPDQFTAVRSGLEGKRGVLQLATGFGKSLVLYFLARVLPLLTKKDVMIIVPNISLVEQMYSDFEEYSGADISHLAEKLFGEEYIKKSLTNKKPILITTWQSLAKKKHSYFERFGSVLVDECHGSKSDVVADILSKCVNSEYRIGLTGTLNKNPLDMMSVYSMLGGTLMVKKSKELQDQGVLSKIKIVNMFVKYPRQYTKVIREYSWQSECQLQETIPARNAVIRKIIGKIEKSSPEDNVLVLVNKREHLEKIWTMLRKEVEPNGWKIRVIHGNIQANKRETIRQEMESSGGQILLATYGTLSTGVNIKRLNHIIFASGYKSEIKVLQSIGRGLRTHSDKTLLILWDLVDDIRFVSEKGSTYMNKLFQHWLERKKYYVEQEFPMTDLEIELKL